MPRTLFATASVPVLEKPEDAADLVTELVPGERVEVVGDSGGWLEVISPGHPTRLDPRGYPGWTRPHDFVETLNWTPTHTIVQRNEAGLPLGSLLRVEDGRHILPSGDEATVGDGDVLPTGVSIDRPASDLAEEFEGLPYRWGGTDSTTGADCSGLVYRVMQLLGILIPRDADDQFDAAPFRSRENWKEARRDDLVFFGSDSITHVGVYLGDGTYISEHGAGGTLVRPMEEDPYIGFARYL